MANQTTKELGRITVVAVIMILISLWAAANIPGEFDTGILYIIMSLIVLIVYRFKVI